MTGGATPGCPACAHGWVEVSDGETLVVAPCETCQPVLFSRWVAGHLNFDHIADHPNCPVCRTATPDQPTTRARAWDRHRPRSVDNEPPAPAPPPTDEWSHRGDLD